MKSKNLDGSLKDTLVGLQHYVDLQIRYNKLLLAKRMGEISSVFTLFMILLIIFSFALLFLSFTFVDWFAAQYDNRYFGNLIVFGFYSLIGLILILFREQFIFGPIRNLFANIFATKEDNGDNKKAFRSKEAIDLLLINYRETIKEEEDDLKEKFEKLGKAFTLPNVIQSAGKSIYKSFVTTSNMARFTYQLVKRIKGGFSKKKEKKRKVEPPLIEDNDD